MTDLTLRWADQCLEPVAVRFNSFIQLRVLRSSLSKISDQFCRISNFLSCNSLISRFDAIALVNDADDGLTCDQLEVIIGKHHQTLESRGIPVRVRFPNYNWSPEGLVAVSGCYPFPYRH
jgi:hypothetical protein